MTTLALAPLTWFNKVGFVLLATGVTYLAVAGQSTAAMLWGAGLVYLVVAAYRSMHGRAGDTERVDAAQPYDERDEAAVRSGFAVVGQVAFLGQIAVVIWHMGRPDEPGLFLEMAQVVILAVVLGVANRVALRRL